MSSTFHAQDGSAYERIMGRCAGLMKYLSLFWLAAACLAPDGVGLAAGARAIAGQSATDAGSVSPTLLSHTLNHVSLRAPGSHDLVVAMDPDFYGNLSLGREPIIQSGRRTSALERIPDSSRTSREVRKVP